MPILTRRSVLRGSLLIRFRKHTSRGDRWFESGFLQRGVCCEPHFRGAFHRRTEGRNPARSKLLRQRTRRWHLDEMVVPIARKRMYLSRAVDREGEILDTSAH
jgi:DDE domain